MLNIINERVRVRNAKYLSDRKIALPTFSEMKNPDLISPDIKKELKEIDLNAVNPINLYRLSWKNQPLMHGGLFDQLPTYIEFPTELTGVNARIIAISGKYFPTGSHKVGASYSCIVPRVLTGEYDLQSSSAVWPSTGNYCRGGAFNAAILGCKSIAVLPKNMSRERFNWLNSISGEVIATPGSESNVREIYAKVKELKQEREDITIFNQFSDFWNYLWHYDVTAKAILELYDVVKCDKGNFAGLCLSSGSSGVLGCATSLKRAFPNAKLAVGEAIQCPTLFLNGYGEHRIEGIGDKHVPWIQNVKNIDVTICVDDSDCMEVYRLFNLPAGREFLRNQGVCDGLLNKLEWCGISGISNLLSAIKFSKYFELNSSDILFTILTDSSDMYRSRIDDEHSKVKSSNYSISDAKVTYYSSLFGAKTDMMKELSYYDKRRIHNLKYFTWVEQHGFCVEELDRQWYDESYWDEYHALATSIDESVREFNCLADSKN